MDGRPDSQLQKAKAQHNMLIANLNRQGYKEVKLHVILVGAMNYLQRLYRQTSGRPCNKSARLSAVVSVQSTRVQERVSEVQKRVDNASLFDSVNLDYHMI